MQRGIIDDNCQECNHNTIGGSMCDWHRSSWMTTEEIADAAKAMRRQELYELERANDPVHERLAASRGRQREFYDTIFALRGM